jgi:hypothetical protein
MRLIYLAPEIQVELLYLPSDSHRAIPGQRDKCAEDRQSPLVEGTAHRVGSDQEPQLPRPENGPLGTGSLNRSQVVGKHKATDRNHRPRTARRHFRESPTSRSLGLLPDRAIRSSNAPVLNCAIAIAVDGGVMRRESPLALSRSYRCLNASGPNGARNSAA